MKTASYQTLRHLNSLPEHKVQEVIRLYKSGLDMQQTANESGVSLKCVWKYLHQRGVLIRGNKVWHIDLTESVISDYESGMTYKAIAEKYNKTENAIQCLLKFYGIYKFNDGRGFHKQVIRTDLDGTNPVTYPTITDASVKNNVGVKYIRQCCNGMRKQTKGYMYEWGCKNA